PFSQDISRPRQIVQERGIVLALASGFLQKAVGPGEIATFVRNLPDNGSDPGIVRRKLPRFLRVSESFLLFLERAGVELGKLGYDSGQFGIDIQRLLKSCGRLV